MGKTILITGGTGLVGRNLIEQLLKRGHYLHLLVRRRGSFSANPNIREFTWDVYKREIDAECIRGVRTIVHLAGEDIGRKRWTAERKQQIIQSRTESVRLIYNLLRTNRHQVEDIISASAVGYYGDRGDEWLHERKLPAKDFLAETCISWEEAVDEGHKLGLRIVRLRSGIILDSRQGALPAIARPLSLWLGIIPGDGRQWISWIHLHDAVAGYLFAIENEDMNGAYNLSAPQPVRLGRMIGQIAAAKERRALFIKIPAFILRLVTGEMSEMVLGSTRTSSEKLTHSGFEFHHSTIESALKDIFGPKEKRQ